MKAIWIQTGKREVSEVDYAGLADLQRMVGGSIELAMRLPDGDVLFVDDNGLFKYHAFFVVPGAHQPFAGNGVIVGRENVRSKRTVKPKITVAEVTAKVRFFHRRDMSTTIGHA